MAALARPPQDVFYQELRARHRRVRLFLPALLAHIRFGANSAGEPILAALDYLRRHELKRAAPESVPQSVVSKRWAPHVFPDAGPVDHRAYTFCVLEQLAPALRRRDLFVSPSWRYADPRVGLLSGNEWEAARPVICRSLGYSPDPKPVLAALAEELDCTYRAVEGGLPNNPDVSFETVNGKQEMSLGALDKIEDPQSLTDLRAAIAQRMPRVDLPEVLFEIATRTGFLDAFTGLLLLAIKP